MSMDKCRLQILAHSLRHNSQFFGPVSYTHLDVYKRQSLHRGGIPCLDASVQVVKRHLQPFGNAPRQIPAVAGSRKIKYHGCSLILCFSVTCLPGRLELVGARPLHLAAARPFGRLKAPLGLSLFCFAPQTRTCRGEAPPSCCRKTVLSLKSPTGAFIVPLRSTNANCLLLRLRRNKQHDCHKNI